MKNKKDHTLRNLLIALGVLFLLRERERAYRSEITPDCRHGCAGCGANQLLDCGVCDP